MRRRAFTLVEMMVSLAVLTLALSVVGVVFSITTRSAGQAAAYSEALHWARQAAEQLKADLAQCDPSASLLVLVGRTQRAGLTADDVAAQRYLRVLTGTPEQKLSDGAEAVGFQTPAGYSEPRADILAFITNRPMASVAPPLNPPIGDPYAGGARLAPALVVYGHAALGEAGWNGANFLWPQTVRHIQNNNDMSPIPAAEWHLARRATILRQDDTEPYYFDGDEPASIVACRALDQTPGDAATLNLAGLLAELERRNYARYLYGPYEIYDEDRDLQTWVDGLLYGPPGGAPRRHVATVIAPEVPVELRSNLGVHLVTGCTWFQVEFLVPEDPRGSAEYSAILTGSGAGARRAGLALWTPVEDGQTYVFIPDTRANREQIVRGNIAAGGQPLGRLAQFARIDQEPDRDDDGIDVVASRRIRLWPYAIRVTFHVYDPRGRLKDPIVRTVVHRFE